MISLYLKHDSRLRENSEVVTTYPDTLWGDLSFQSIWQYIYLRLPKTFTVFAGCQGGIDYNVLKLSEATFGKILGNWGIITTKNTTGTWEK